MNYETVEATVQRAMELANYLDMVSPLQTTT